MRSCPTSSRSRRLACVVLLPALCAGGVAAATAPEERDPFEKVNRATFAFNDALDRMLAKPLARAYRAAIPKTARHGVSNVLTNLSYPTTLVNNALQGKFSAASTDVLRVVVNTSIGLGGLFDPATRMGIPSYDEDFGQTLGRWGLPSGPYLVVPMLGPSSFRDAPGRFADRYTDGRRHLGGGSTDWALTGFSLIDRRVELLALDDTLRAAFDPYAMVRNAYLARRDFLASDGQPPEEWSEELPLEDPIPVDAPPASEAGPESGSAARTPEAAGSDPGAASAASEATSADDAATSADDVAVPGATPPTP